MRKTRMGICFARIGVWFTICALGVAGASAAGGATFRVISTMNQYDQPNGLIEGSPGVFYGGAGSATQIIFSITTQGAMTVLASFSTGYNTQDPPVSGPNGRFYSAVQLSDYPANVFSVTAARGGKQLYTAQNLVPILYQNLPNGNFIGTAVALSASPFYLAGIDLKGTVTPIYQFPSSELPGTPLYASDGNYYGLSTPHNGASYVFRVTPSGSLTKLHTFPSGTYTGFFAVPLLQASDGNLYGAPSLPAGPTRRESFTRSL